MNIQPDPESVMRVHHRATPKVRKPRPEARNGPVEKSWVHPGILAIAREFVQEFGGSYTILTPTKIEINE